MTSFIYFQLTYVAPGVVYMGTISALYKPRSLYIRQIIVRSGQIDTFFNIHSFFSVILFIISLVECWIELAAIEGYVFFQNILQLLTHD